MCNSASSSPAFLALALLAASAAAQAGVAHPGPSLWGDLKVHGHQVVLVVEGAADPLTTNLGLDRLLLGRIVEAERDRLERRIQERFARGNPLELDGTRVVPRLAELLIQDAPADEASWRSARIVLVYPASRPPRSVSLTWESFAGEGVEYVPFTIRAGAFGTPMMFVLRAEEPQYVWHVADGSARPPPRLRLAGATRTGLALPTALFAAGALLCAGAIRPRRRLGGPLAAAALLGAAAFLSRDVRAFRLPLPGDERVALPAPVQAAAIFDEVLRGVYEAFAAQDEADVYDRLAACVTRDLLEELYGQVYESLILREEGGAVCSVDRVEIDENVVDPQPWVEGAEEPRFEVEAAWRVQGVVAHWGHVHRRENRARARVEVRHDGEAWKIAGLEVREHEAVDEE